MRLLHVYSCDSFSPISRPPHALLNRLFQQHVSLWFNSKNQLTNVDEKKNTNKSVAHIGARKMEQMVQVEIWSIMRLDKSSEFT